MVECLMAQSTHCCRPAAARLEAGVAEEAKIAAEIVLGASCGEVEGRKRANRRAAQAGLTVPLRPQDATGAAFLTQEFRRQVRQAALEGARRAGAVRWRPWPAVALAREAVVAIRREAARGVSQPQTPRKVTGKSEALQRRKWDPEPQRRLQEKL